MARENKEAQEITSRQEQRQGQQDDEPDEIFFAEPGPRMMRKAASRNRGSSVTA